MDDFKNFSKGAQRFLIAGFLNTTEALKLRKITHNPSKYIDITNEKMDIKTNTLHGDDNHHFDWWIFPLPINNSNKISDRSKLFQIIFPDDYNKLIKFRIKSYPYLKDLRDVQRFLKYPLV